MNNNRKHTKFRSGEQTFEQTEIDSDMANAMINGDRIEIRGFCSFFIKEYNGYTGRNPKTGEKAFVPPKRLPFFKCGKDLKDRVDYRSKFQ
jgi:integration host factor subunit beta